MCFHPVIDAFLLLTGASLGVTVLVFNWQRRTANETPFLRRSVGDFCTAAVVLVCTLAAGGLCGLGVAMALDHIMGVWGLLLAGGICAGPTIAMIARRTRSDEP